MNRILFLICITWACIWVPHSAAITWPMIDRVVITSCNDSPEFSCASDVYYSGSGSVLRQINDVMPPPPRLKYATNIYPWGIHCGKGKRESSFTSCEWTLINHSPVLISACWTAGDGSWTLDRGVTCATGTTWGSHSGAGPGAECVVFGLAPSPGATSVSRIETPMGILDAHQVANSGNSFCVKPLPPSTRCELNLGGSTLAHGVVGTHASSMVSLSGSVDCGGAPSITFVGGNVLILGTGVKTRLSAVMVNRNTITIRSELTTSGAEPRSYQASTILVVSPW